MIKRVVLIFIAISPLLMFGSQSIAYTQKNRVERKQDFVQENRRSGNYEVAAKVGDVEAMYEAGTTCLSHHDYIKAAEWFQKAASKGKHAAAMYKLGLMSDAGKGVPKNYSKAAEWYKAASDNGDFRGATNLGYLYLHGQGVPQDYTRAREYFERAIELSGDRTKADVASFNLGYIHELGLGVPKDVVRASFCYGSLPLNDANAAVLRCKHKQLDPNDHGNQLRYQAQPTTYHYTL